MISTVSLKQRNSGQNRGINASHAEKNKQTECLVEPANFLNKAINMFSNTTKHGQCSSRRVASSIVDNSNALPAENYNQLTSTCPPTYGRGLLSHIIIGINIVIIVDFKYDTSGFSSLHTSEKLQNTFACARERVHAQVRTRACSYAYAFTRTHTNTPIHTNL